MNHETLSIGYLYVHYCFDQSRWFDAKPAPIVNIIWIYSRTVTSVIEVLTGHVVLRGCLLSVVLHVAFLAEIVLLGLARCDHLSPVIHVPQRSPWEKTIRYFILNAKMEEKIYREIYAILDLWTSSLPDSQRLWISNLSSSYLDMFWKYVSKIPSGRLPRIIFLYFRLTKHKNSPESQDLQKFFNFHEWLTTNLTT